MFTGFDRSAFEFFMALGFNNNREFFHANHAWYQKSVREPLGALCMALAPGMLALDPELEVRPRRVISHINRDLRFSRDKSPYRDYMWLGYHRVGWAKCECFHMYFDIGAQASHFGAGMFGDDRDWMQRVRERMLHEPKRMCALQDGALKAGFELKVHPYKRFKQPDGLPDELYRWYASRSFYFERDLKAEELESAALVDALLDGFGALKPIYEMMYSVRPERESDPDSVKLSGTFYGPDADGECW